MILVRTPTKERIFSREQDSPSKNPLVCKKLNRPFEILFRSTSLAQAPGKEALEWQPLRILLARPQFGGQQVLQMVLASRTSFAVGTLVKV